MVDEKDREAYEAGQDHAEKSSVEQVITEIFNNPVPDSESEAEAFGKGYRGEQLDGDKKD